MPSLVYRAWTFDVDSELTRKTYENQPKGGADECSCDYCKNYSRIRDTVFPAEFLNFLVDLGIDYRKEHEITELGKSGDNKRHYWGWFHVAGKVLSGPKFHSTESAAVSFTPIGENFKIGFHEANSPSFFDNTVPLVQVEFSTDLPWVLEHQAEPD